ncbi:unnamed protein product [Cuscuta europaea]|uniref:Uncharacterized protein n=1 Tax=Cuscuta europaea TaxID=41803 RepID=A0A9P1E3K0_CUSEU|nr:unnamed protein product [Cuscuta europaea]
MESSASRNATVRNKEMGSIWSCVGVNETGLLIFWLSHLWPKPSILKSPKIFLFRPDKLILEIYLGFLPLDVFNLFLGVMPPRRGFGFVPPLLCIVLLYVFIITGKRSLTFTPPILVVCLSG